MDQDGGAAARCREVLEVAACTAAGQWAAARRSAPPFWIEGLPPSLVQALDELGAARRALREAETAQQQQPARAARAPRRRPTASSSGASVETLPLWGS